MEKETVALSSDFVCLNAYLITFDAFVEVNREIWIGRQSNLQCTTSQCDVKKIKKQKKQNIMKCVENVRQEWKFG